MMIIPMKAQGTGQFTPLVPQLLAILEQSSDNHDQWRALQVLSAIDHDAAAAVLVLITLLDVPHLQAEAADALRAIGLAAAPAVPALIHAMFHPLPLSNYAHYQAAHALGAIGDPRAIPALMEAAQDPDNQGPGWFAIDSLRMFGSQARDAVPLLLKLLDDERYEWSGDIIHALAAIGPAAGPAWNVILEQLRREQDEDSRIGVAESLYHLLFSGGPIHADAHAVFEKLAHDQNAEVQQWAEHALQHIKSYAASDGAIK